MVDMARLAVDGYDSLQIPWFLSPASAHRATGL